MNSHINKNEKDNLISSRQESRPFTHETFYSHTNKATNTANTSLPFHQSTPPQSISYQRDRYYNLHNEHLLQQNTLNEFENINLAQNRQYQSANLQDSKNVLSRYPAIAAESSISSRYLRRDEREVVPPYIHSYSQSQNAYNTQMSYQPQHQEYIRPVIQQQQHQQQQQQLHQQGISNFNHKQQLLNTTYIKNKFKEEDILLDNQAYSNSNPTYSHLISPASSSNYNTTTTRSIVTNYEESNRNETEKAMMSTTSTNMPIVSNGLDELQKHRYQTDNRFFDNRRYDTSLNTTNTTIVNNSISGNGLESPPPLPPPPPPPPLPLAMQSQSQVVPPQPMQQLPPPPPPQPQSIPQPIPQPQSIPQPIPQPQPMPQSSSNNRHFRNILNSSATWDMDYDDNCKGINSGVGGSSNLRDDALANPIERNEVNLPTVYMYKAESSLNASNTESTALNNNTPEIVNKERMVVDCEGQRMLALKRKMMSLNEKDRGVVFNKAFQILGWNDVMDMLTDAFGYESVIQAARLTQYHNNNNTNNNS